MSINPFALVNSPINPTALDKAYEAMGKQTNPFASFLTGAGNQVKTIGKNLSEFNTANLARELNNMQGEELTGLKNMGRGRYLDILADRGYGNGMAYNPDDVRVTNAYNALDKAERGQVYQKYLEKLQRSNTPEELTNDDYFGSLGVYNRDANDIAAAKILQQNAIDTYAKNQGIQSNYSDSTTNLYKKLGLDPSRISTNTLNTINTERKTNAEKYIKDKASDLLRYQEVKDGKPYGTYLNDPSHQKEALSIFENEANNAGIDLRNITLKNTTDADFTSQNATREKADTQMQKQVISKGMLDLNDRLKSGEMSPQEYREAVRDLYFMNNSDGADTAITSGINAYAEQEVNKSIQATSKVVKEALAKGSTETVTTDILSGKLTAIDNLLNLGMSYNEALDMYNKFAQPINNHIDETTKRTLSEQARAVSSSWEALVNSSDLTEFNKGFLNKIAKGEPGKTEGYENFLNTLGEWTDEYKKNYPEFAANLDENAWHAIVTQFANQYRQYKDSEDTLPGKDSNAYRNFQGILTLVKDKQLLQKIQNNKKYSGINSINYSGK